MRITALYDAEGRILDAVVLDGQYKGPMPVVTEGSTLGTFDVPDFASGLRLDQICTTLRADARSQRLVDPKREKGSAT